MNSVLGIWIRTHLTQDNEPHPITSGPDGTGFKKLRRLEVISEAEAAFYSNFILCKCRVGGGRCDQIKIAKCL